MTRSHVVLDRRELELLNRIAYVIEAIAEDAPGEAADALLGLRVDTDAFDDPMFGLYVARVFESARRPRGASPDWGRQAAVALSALNRELWDRVLGELPPEADAERKAHDGTH